MKISTLYKYKDGRTVKLININENRGRCEVIEGEYNSFWININDLKEI